MSAGERHEGPGRLRRAVGRAAQALLDMVYPRLCAVCGRSLEEPEFPHLCGECLVGMRRIGEACGRCGLPTGPYAETHDGRWCFSCKQLTLGFHECVAAVVYEEPAKSLVTGLKYGRRMHLAATLGEMLARRVGDALDASGYDCIVPVALHPARRRERGFDQAELLAQHLSRSTGLPVVAAVRRVRETPAQAALSRTARFANLKGAFEAALPDELRGRRVIIVDDVMTTGATASECAKALRAAGAEHVAAAVAARALRG